MQNDEVWMRLALQEARLAAAEGEIPVGAVLVRDGQEVCRAHNLRENQHDPTAHAEILCMRRGAEKLGTWRLRGCTLYVTLEPCPMCAGAIVQARVKEVVIGAMNPKAGCAGSILNLFTMKQFNHQVQTTYGVCEAECSQILKQFFAGLRKRLHETDGSGICNRK